MDLLPKVFRTEGDVVDFEPTKIFTSIIKETNMKEDDAKQITELVVRRIISSGMKFLSGPHIREIVCSILSENHYEQERKLYTRIGMPLMDYEEILESGITSGDKIILNPEKIHHWAANQLAEEYTLLRILTDEESKAHLFGDIYIHQLKYFDLRPYDQYYDPRLILKHGIPPLDKISHVCKSKAAKNLREATDHLINWLEMIQTEFSGNQGIEFITIFLAPYCRGLENKEIKSILKSFIYKINFMAKASGKSRLKTSVSYSPNVIPQFLEMPIVNFNGIDKGDYSSYVEECRRMFDILSEISVEGDSCGNFFPFPSQLIYLNDESLKTNLEQIETILKGVLSGLNISFINSIRNKRFKNKIGLFNKSITNYGVMQKISMNLPRFAYISKDENHFEEVLLEKVKLCFEILEKKYSIILQRLKTKHLPLCSGKINGTTFLNLDNQELCIGIVGLNEAVKILTNNELHEDESVFKLGKSILNVISKACKEQSNIDSKNYSIIDSSSKRAIQRFLRLDQKHFPKLNMNKYQKSTKFSPMADLNLKDKIYKQAILHEFIKVEPKLELSLKKDLIKDVEELKQILMYICKETELNMVRFI